MLPHHRDTITFSIPGGYCDADGRRHCEVELAPLSGYDEEWLALNPALPRPLLTTTLLSHCMQRVGTIAPVTAAVARALPVADRQYALLKLREATFGPRFTLIAVCPWPACGSKFNIDFMADDVPMRAVGEPGPLYHTQLAPEAADADQRGITFRLPDGGDQEALWPLLQAGDEAGAATLLLARCIQSIGPATQPDQDMIARLSLQARAAIERQIEAVAPQLELVMEGVCAECGRDVSIPFDVEDSVFQEVRASSGMFQLEVHYLAYHYHWSEREILQMTRARRRRYITTLAEQIEAMNHGS